MRARASSVPDHSGHASFIYCFGFSDNQRIKLGYSGPRQGHDGFADVAARIREQDDGRCEFYWAVPGTREQEQELHAFFDNCRDNRASKREVFWFEGEVRNFVEWVRDQPFAATTLTAESLRQSFAPLDWLPWMQPQPREFEGQGVLTFPGFNWTRKPPKDTSDEYYTLEEDFEPARVLLGDFDLDPASHPNANIAIKAKRIYTIEHEALHLEWRARTVWLNPPYSLSNSFTTKLIGHYENGDVGSAVAFLSARSVSDHWFHELGVFRYPVCFRRGRGKFRGPNGKGDAAHFGHLWLYLGTEHERFYELFSPLGEVLVRWRET